MWHELFRLRETYLSLEEIKTEVHREYVRNLFLYETLKLSGNNLPETEFYEMFMNEKYPHTTEGRRAYDLWQTWKFINKKADKHDDLSLDLVRGIAAKVMKHTGREISKQACYS